MHVKSLYLKQFRHFSEVHLEFTPHLNLICGPNAQGKTTLLEAIRMLMIGKSFRPGQQKDLIKIGSDFCYIEANICKYGVDQNLRMGNSIQERKIFHNSTPLNSISDLIGIIYGVVMTPDDASLVKGSPQERRKFLDIQIAQSDPLYVHHLMRYGRAMQHRNALLKQKVYAAIENWEYEMAHAGAYIHTKRKKLISGLKVVCQEFYSYLTDEVELFDIEYKSSANRVEDEPAVKEFYIKQFHKNRERESFIGYTLVGPHKDDLWIGIGGQDIRYYASEGQQRSSVTALHVGEWKLLREQCDELPILMIDDVGISLDRRRRQRLLDQLVSMGQVFLTTTDEALLSDYRGPNTTIRLPSYDTA
jgi:DNA replication and repair protein RecF